MIFDTCNVVDKIWVPPHHPAGQRKSSLCALPTARMILAVKASDNFVLYCISNPTLFQSCIIPILLPSNLAFFQLYTLPILHPSNLTLF